MKKPIAPLFLLLFLAALLPVRAAAEEPLPVLPVTMGERETVSLTLPAEGTTAVVEKTKASSLERRLTLPDTLTSPVAAGQPVGTLTLCSGGEELLTVPVLSAEDIPSRTWSRMFTDLLRMAVFAS